MAIHIHFKCCLRLSYSACLYETLLPLFFPFLLWKVLCVDFLSIWLRLVHMESSICFPNRLFYRIAYLWIVELLRLEKTCKITKSNNQPRTSTVVTTKTCPQVPYPLPGMMTPPLPWAPCLITLTINNFFLIHTLNLPWCKLRLFPVIPSLFTQEKRLSPTWLRPLLR